MKTVVVYESVVGNTRTIAERIADAASKRGEVVFVPVAHASPKVVVGADLVVVGGPTHVHGLSWSSTRKAGAEDAAKHEGRTAEPDWEGPGLRAWLRHLDRAPRTRAVAFDTRFDASPAATGRASKGIDRRLRHHGFRMVASPESFLVDKESHLVDGEADRATTWATGVLDELQLAG